MTAEGFTHTREAVTVDTASPVNEERLREFYGGAYESLGMGV
jgi:hypothetical protein